MRPRELCNKLNEFFEEGMANGLFLAIQPHLLSDTGDKKVLSPVGSPGMISPGGVAFGEFIQMLDDSTYSSVFFDGSVAIVQCRFIGDDIDNHRYSFIPCPVDRDLINRRPEASDLAEWLREEIENPSDHFRSLGTYRFDCVRDIDHKEDDPHPVSHMTFASPDCRLPLSSPMSPAGFFDFLFDNFYRPFKPLWENYAPHLRCGGTTNTLTNEERLKHYLLKEDNP